MNLQMKATAPRSRGLLLAVLAGAILGVVTGGLLARRAAPAPTGLRTGKDLSLDAATSPVERTAALGSGSPASSAPPPNGIDVVHLQVEHTRFHPLDNIVLEVERMDGRMIARPGAVISLDDPSSFSVQVDASVTRLSATSLSALINSYLLRRADSAVRHVDVSFDGQQVIVKGRVHKLLTLPFVGRGELSATPDGELRMHMVEFRVAGILNRKFLAFFGIRLDDVAQPKNKPSFRVEGNDFITSLNELFPPPRVYGRLTSVHVEHQQLVQIIGIEPVPHAIQQIPKALPEPANYIYFFGGRMRFGRMTMDNVDLKMVDQTPKDPFDFSLAHYQRQIQSGYVKVMPNQGVVVYAGDADVPNAHQKK